MVDFVKLYTAMLAYLCFLETLVLWWLRGWWRP